MCIISCRFPWINGRCGITFNPKPRLYVTVALDRENDEDFLKKDMDEKFGWKASEYVEFRYAKKSSPTFRYLSNLKFRENENFSRESSGTVTMFCRKDRKD